MPDADRDAIAALTLQVRKQAARDVCSWCGRRSYPNVPEAHRVYGPNSAGNYVHQTPVGTELCDATSIWARIRFEHGAEAIPGDRTVTINVGTRPVPDGGEQ